MAKTGETYTTKLSRAPRGLLIPLIYATLVACGGSGGTTSATTVAPPTTPPVARPPTTCSISATARDGTRYSDPIGAPRCLAHLHSEVDNLQDSGDIPEGARGVAFIYDFFWDHTSSQDPSQLFNEGGLDGNGNYFLTTSDHTRLHSGSHGAIVRGVYNTISPVLPSAVVSIALRETSIASQNTVLTYEYSGEQVRRAYLVARSDNPLITRSAASSPYAAHKAIFNFSLGAAHGVFHSVTRELSSLSAFDAKSNYAEIPTGIIGVGALGNSNANWSTGFRKASGDLLDAGFFLDGFSNSSIAARIDDTESVYWDSVELDTDLTDLIASTPTSQLLYLVDHSSWETPTHRIASIFPDITGNLAAKVNEAGRTRLSSSRPQLQLSLLDLLAGATVHARTGHYYTASYLNSNGDATAYNTPCGVLQDGCFILPFYLLPGGRPSGTSSAAPRLTAVIDTLWLVWPELTHISMHGLLSSCTFDLGAPGVDSVFGQGLLDLECLLNPSGGVQIPTAQVAGIAGSLVGPSTADTSLSTHDDFGRHFNYSAVRTQTSTLAFNPLQNAHVYTSSQSTLLAVNQDTASAWVTYSLLKDLRISLGAVYEQNSLLGTYGTGHFQIQDGYSSGGRLDWIHRLNHLWNTRMHIAYYRGTAQTVYPGAVSALNLRQSSFSVSLERHLTYNGMATSRLEMSFSCNTGTWGSFNSFGTPVTLSGKENCEQRLGMALYF